MTSRTAIMASNRGYDAVVDVDEEVVDEQASSQSLDTEHNLQSDLAHTDLHEDLEFHSSSMYDALLLVLV